MGFWGDCSTERGNLPKANSSPQAGLKVLQTVNGQGGLFRTVTPETQRRRRNLKILNPMPAEPERLAPATEMTDAINQVKRDTKKKRKDEIPDTSSPTPHDSQDSEPRRTAKRAGIPLHTPEEPSIARISHIASREL